MDNFHQHYNSLNSEQRTAVDHIDGPLLVLAGPGTGKTQLLSVRAANILKKGKVDPSEILILTFTNAAARNMRERLAAIIGFPGYDVEVETFHGFANSIVLESEEALGYIKNKIEISEVEKIRSIEYILDNVKGTEALRPFGAPYINRSEIEKRISELKNEGISPEEFKNAVKKVKPDGIYVEDKHIPRLRALSVIYDNYEKMKDSSPSVLFDERGRYDFDDMIFLALEAIQNSAELKKKFKRRFKYIMVDEFQDTNGAQLKLLFSIINDSKNICCVGDDDQAIYRFQGATLDNFRKLSDRIPGLDTVTLERNYRSSQLILEVSGKIIKQISEDERISDKKLYPQRKYNATEVSFFEFKTEEEELSYIVDLIKNSKKEIEKDTDLSAEEKSRPYNNIAILVRKRENIKKIIDACLRGGIPYATDGKEDIRQEKRVRQMIDVLALADIDLEETERKSLLLYNVLSSDYMKIDPTDLLKFVALVNKLQKEKYTDYVKETDPELRKKILSFSLFDLFFDYFYSENEEGCSKKIDNKVFNNVLELNCPEAFIQAAAAIAKMIRNASSATVHDILMQYIEDVGLYQYILDTYDDQKLIRIRELRGLISFINMVKDAGTSVPGLRLREFISELELREMHGMPVQGKLATMSQEGVRIYTAHASKGLEFHTVIIPFCLDKKNWPVRTKGDVVPLPPKIYKSREKVKEKSMIKKLTLYDEIRLFYVAATRARSKIFYSSTPQDKNISSQFLFNAEMVPKMKVFSEEKFLSEYITKIRNENFTKKETMGVLKNIVSEITLNPTSLGTYIDCKRKFLYNDVLRLPGKKNQHLVFGNCVHGALEAVYNIYREKGVFPTFNVFKNSFKKELLFQGAKGSIRNWCLDRLEGLEPWYKKESTDPIMPIELEKKIEIHFPQGFVFTGKFDKIEPFQNGIRVVDYKTGKPDKHVKSIYNCKDIGSSECDNYYRQLICYKLLYDNSNKCIKSFKVIKGNLHFVEPVGASVKKYGLEKGVFFDIDVDLNEEMVENMKKLISRVWDNIQSLDFDKLEKRDGKEKCRNCPYDALCWG